MITIMDMATGHDERECEYECVSVSASASSDVFEKQENTGYPFSRPLSSGLPCCQLGLQEVAHTKPVAQAMYGRRITHTL